MQGKTYQQFTHTEFPLLLDLVNKLKTNSHADYLNPDLFRSTPLSHLWDQTPRDEPPNVQEVPTTASISDDNTTPTLLPQSEIHPTGEFLKIISDDIQDIATPPLSLTPSRVHTLTSLRTSVANMESDFVAFKMETSQITQSLHIALDTFDSGTKDKFNQLENDIKVRTKKTEEETKELAASNETMTEQLRTLSLTVKKLQEQMNASRKKHNELEEKYTSLKEDYDSIKEELESLRRGPETLGYESAGQPTGELPVAEGVDTPATVITTDMPLRNRFGALQDDQEERPAHPSNTDATPHDENQEGAETDQKEKQQPHETLHSGRSPSEQSRTTGNEKSSTAQKANIIILCDWNGKYIRPTMLCPNKNTTYLRCPTVSRGCEIITTLAFDSPEAILMHTGTNDLELSVSAEHLAAQINTLTS